MLAEIELLRAACCVAGLDGNVAPAELAILSRLAERAGVSRGSFEEMLRHAQADPTFHRQQFTLVRREPEGTVRQLLQIAGAEGGVSDDEARVIAGFGERLGLSAEACSALIAAARARA